MCGREEIQRIKAARPDIPHREAFSMAAKNVSLTSSFSCLYKNRSMHQVFI
jgi:hypothetical protein